MTYNVDTVVIGGGPAGAACAITLQQREISNLILEQRAFPRHKTCGGLMTEKTYRLLTQLLEEAAIPGVFCDISRTVELYGADGRLTRSEVEHPLRSVRRVVFDNALIERYRALGSRDCLEAYRRRCFVLGRRVTILSGGIAVAEGEALALEPDYSLRIRYDDGTEGLLNSGEVSVLP